MKCEKRFDGNGHINIPAHIRDELGFEKEEIVELFVRDGELVIKKKDNSVLDYRRITNVKLDSSYISKLKNEYIPGTRVRLLYMSSDNPVILINKSKHIKSVYTVPEKTLGTVVNVDDIGTIHIDWDNKVSCGINESFGDSIEII